MPSKSSVFYSFYMRWKMVWPQNISRSFSGHFSGAQFHYPGTNSFRCVLSNIPSVVSVTHHQCGYQLSYDPIAPCWCCSSMSNGALIVVSCFNSFFLMQNLVALLKQKHLRECSSILFHQFQTESFNPSFNKTLFFLERTQHSWDHFLQRCHQLQIEMLPSSSEVSCD